jgi:inward rectifier potassium channel
MTQRRAQFDGSPLSGVMRGNRRVRVKPIGSSRWHPSDVYHELLQMSWPQLALTFVLLFLGFNLFFAGLYSLDPTGINWGDTRVNATPFWRAFFFSVDTVATVGYGNMYPISVLANVLVVIEITFGILFFAIVTGIAFARFSRPTARVLFSDVAVIADIDGNPTLMFRAANQRHNLFFDARASVSVLIDKPFAGTTMRRFEDLELVRSSTPVFVLTWTMVHPITSGSPLSSWILDQEIPANGEIMVLLSGTDERSSQTIHARWAYRPDDIRWNSHFVDILGELPDGTRTIDYRRFHDVEPDLNFRPT